MLAAWIFIGAAFAAAPAPAAATPVPLAATPVFHRYGVADGLPSSVVYKLAQDRDGFIWAGTHDGLARYDGVGFRIFRNDPLDPATIGGNEVSALYVDRENRVWAGGETSGLNVLDAARRAFRRYRHADADPGSLAADDVWAVTEDLAGAIWVGTYSGGLARLRDDAAGFERYGRANGLASDTVLSLAAAADGGLWIGTDQGLDRRARDGRVEHAALDAFRSADGRLMVLAIVADGDGVLAATGNGLLRVGSDLAATRLDRGAPGRMLYGLARGDAAGDLWLATRHGLVLRSADGAEKTFPGQPYLAGGLPGEALFDALRDAEGGLWLAALDGGVAYLGPQWRRFVQVREEPGVATSLSRGRYTATALAPDGRIVAVNATGAVERIDPASGATEHLAERVKPVDPRLRAVLADAHGRLWLGHQRGLQVYDSASGQSKNVEADAKREDALPAGAVDLLAQGAGGVWASARGAGLGRIDPATLAVHRYAAGAANGPRDGDIGSLSLAPDGALWVAHNTGLDRYDPAADRFEPVTGLPAERVHMVLVDGADLWLHRLGALERYRAAGPRLTRTLRIDTTDGWPALVAGGLARDRAGVLWATTPRGLFRLDPESRRLRRYDGIDGLLSPEFIERSLSVRDDGVLVATTTAGVIAFDPHVPDAALPPPPLRLTEASLRRGGERLQLDPAQPIALAWGDRDLRIAARALSYAGTRRYQFRLEGFDTDWGEAGASADREFVQLPPGNYSLHLRAAIAGGVWTETGAPLAISVAPPPWATGYAYALYAVLLALLAGGVTGVLRRRVARGQALALAEQQRRLAEQASRAKSDFLAHMGHEIRTPMTGVLGMSELLLRTPLEARQRGYVEGIRSSGEHMLRLVNDALDLARIEAGRFEIEDEPFAPGALLREVADVAATLAQRKGLSAAASVDADVPAFVRGDPRRVRQILLNLANNAVKFTTTGGVQLSLKRGADGALVFGVRDTGPGIAPDQQQRLFQRYAQTAGGRRAGGSGLGLAISRELAEHMGGRLELESTPGEGSEFRLLLTLPVTDAAPNEVPPAPDVPTRALNVLLVEDDVTVAATLRGLLEALGHRVQHAPHGLAALVELDGGRVDLALVDLDLPGVDGLELARLLRLRETQKDLPRLPLVAITARSEPEAEAQARASGMDAFLRKPVTLARLGATLAAFAARSERVDSVV